jgi:hypothetical protein
MVEAAIVFPLVIAAVMAVIHLMIALYSLTATQAALHVALRAAAGDETGLTRVGIVEGRPPDRYRRAAEAGDVRIERRDAVLRPYLSAEVARTYSGNAMVREDVERRHFGRSYLIDEARIVRAVEWVRAL